MVFTSPGTYDAGGGKQKTAFGVGTVYFRHGAKSEPGTSEDLRVALERELTRIRSSWLDGIAKLVTAPPGATVSVLPAEVSLSGADSSTGVRLVNDEAAPAFKAMRTDLLYPHRQKEVVVQVNKILGTNVISGHDVFSVRRTHAIESQPNFFYKPQWSSPQYSQAFVECGGPVPRRSQFLRQGPRGVEEGLGMKGSRAVSRRPLRDLDELRPFEGIDGRRLLGRTADDVEP